MKMPQPIGSMCYIKVEYLYSNDETVAVFEGRSSEDIIWGRRDTQFSNSSFSKKSLHTDPIKKAKSTKVV